MARSLWAIVGVLALGIGVLGVILPVLPTTPFVILAAFAFAKGSPRLARWLETHRIFGPVIDDWRQSGAIESKYKALAIFMMGAAFGASILAGFAPHILVIQGLCISGAAAFILSRPSR